MAQPNQYDRLIGNGEKAVIHVAKAKLGMTEDEYRDLLGSVGVLSSVELTHRMFDQIMEKMERAGFQRSDKAWKPLHKSARASGMHRRPPADKEAMIRKIEAILTELKLEWSYADGIAIKQFGVEKLAWCDAEQTHKVLQALAVYQRRVRARAGTSSKPARARGTR